MVEEKKTTWNSLSPIEKCEHDVPIYLSCENCKKMQKPVTLQIDSSEVTLHIEETVYTVTDLIGIINYIKNLSQMDVWEIGLEADALRSKAITLVGKSQR